MQNWTWKLNIWVLPPLKLLVSVTSKRHPLPKGWFTLVICIFCLLQIIYAELDLEIKYLGAATPELSGVSNLEPPPLTKGVVYSCNFYHLSLANNLCRIGPGN